ncbi:glycine dehydrogenase (decarboxylating) [Elysia marginata]|uniref:Glycine cleavage system P protein n=1 Tax=Elysia marginata TaxID=1093978 RepID=A0AAV4FPJ0_9GAST|nr:glycine dehydrogenase (decarboxylating) [Elysia marginata]
MLKTLGVGHIDQLISQTIPEDILSKEPLNITQPKGLSEYDFSQHIKELGKNNTVFKNFIGLGYHDTLMPAVIRRNIFENPGWYTAYTPYQSEISQGRLEALLNFQTMIAEFTGMEIANASLLDESTAVSEAMTMFFNSRNAKQKEANRRKFFVSEDVLPQTIAVLKTKAEPLEIEIVIGDDRQVDLEDGFFGAVMQYPEKFGAIKDLSTFVDVAKIYDVKVCVSADLLALAILKPPGDFGVDVVVGSSQRFGIPIGFGGPHAAFLATKEEYKRFIPGRIIGISKDANGDIALRMALQTREQHIKRDKATSNICTAQVLLAVMAGMYAVYHGFDGIQKIAKGIHLKTAKLNNVFEKMGIQQLNKIFFDTLLIKVNSEKVKSLAEIYSYNFNYIDDSTISISLNETTTHEDVTHIIQIFSKAEDKKYKEVDNDSVHINPHLLRKDDILTQDVFKKYHSETEMMRYIKSLEKKDLALNHSMIPLGSCTMKLNAASEMLPLGYSNWTDIHPFAPSNQWEGYRQLISDLENCLAEITGFSATSVQPNSGAQGEYTGLRVIQKYHLSRGENHRNICLIPESAHGTNPASATMSGMKVVVVKTTMKGEIDIQDLRQKANLHSKNLSSLMITYPSTYGVFEDNIKEVTKIIHDHKGQVYMDGANMNAQVGLTNPFIIGADVCHLNLHKTFAIPHGGGGPGVGPICVATHLAEFLPSHPLVKTGGAKGLEAISAAPFGSPLVCLISYGYIKMLGNEGLKASTETAILNANYIKQRLSEHYPILYSNANGRVAHEMIIDCRGFKKNGIEVIDIAKRLIDYGFHAPTVSFPVIGTLMIEPTESESKEELDRFCDALINIKSEIEYNPEIIKNAPHSLKILTSNDWGYSYSREAAAYPLPYLKTHKFWTPVSRIDDAYGDRNLMCTCPSVEDFQS